MAKTKADIYNAARELGVVGENPVNPFREGSWQYAAYDGGLTEGLKQFEAEQVKRVNEVKLDPGAALLKELGVSELAPFPARMPSPTREHVSRINYMACSTKDSSLALRLDRKINKLYQRWA